MRRYAAILLLLFSVILDARSGPGVTGRFVNYSAANGLPSNTVYAIVQDGDGNLWVGTRGGLSRFDGIHFQTVLPDKRINALAVDPDDRIWAGTTDGLYVVDGASFSSCRQGHNIRALLADSNGCLWATVGDTLLLKLSYSASEGIREETRTFYNKRFNEGDYPYYQIYEDHQGTLWLGGRIVRCQYVRDREHPQSQLAYSDTFCAGNYAEVDGTLYAIDDHTSRLFTIGETDANWMGRLPVAHARLLTDHKGQLWAAGSYGLARVDIHHPEKSPVYKHNPDDPASIASAELFCIFEDRQGNLWVGGDNGLSVLCPALQLVQQLDIPSKQVTALLQSRDGRIWVGTADSGAYITDGSGKPAHIDFRPAGRPNEGHVSCLYQDSEGTVYIGLYAGCGFNIWQNGHVRRGAVRGPIPEQQHIMAWEDRITSNWITDFLEDRDGRFWVVTWEGVGLNEWDRKTGRTAPPEWLSPFFYPTPEVDSNIYLSSRLGSRLIEDADGNLVFGTTEAGLNIVDRKTRLVTKYLPDPADTLSLPDNYVTDLCLAPDGALWVATHSGLWSPSGRRYLNGKLTQSVRADSKGRLWVGTEEGLYFIDTDGSIGVARKGLGFPSDIYNERTTCLLADGRLAFGGPEGAVLVHPDSLLAIQASGNLPLAPLVQHRYRLNKGEWVYDRFTGLPEHIVPGRYVLEEQCTDAFGRWERGESRSSEIRVPLPLLLRWPFLLLYLLLILGLIWLVIRLRERRILIQELDTRNRFFSIISHDLRNPVTGNRLLSRQLLDHIDTLSTDQLKEGLQALSDSTEETSSLLENLLLWSLDQKGMLEPVMREENLAALATEAAGSIHKNEIIVIDIPAGLTVRTDRNMLLTCLRNLLENAVKVSPKGEKVRLSARDRQIVITDRGPGIKENSTAWGHGLGLVITRDLLNKMGASMTPRNRPEGGLEITLNL